MDPRSGCTRSITIAVLIMCFMMRYMLFVLIKGCAQAQNKNFVASSSSRCIPFLQTPLAIVPSMMKLVAASMVSMMMDEGLVYEKPHFDFMVSSHFT